MSRPVHDAVRDALRDAPGADARVVLAVSGGLDSMALLHAAAAVVPRARLLVATFDHGTGQSATDASKLVAARCRTLGIECQVGHATTTLGSEAALRAARWTFLRGVAATASARVATAHTEDDQLETVLMRVLRDSGARGLAGLYATSDVIRPFLSLRRRQLANYAAAEGVTWIDDPSNTSRRFLRNRVRHDLLPALRRVHPELDSELLATARNAATLRENIDRHVDAALDVRLVHGPGAERGGLDVAVPSLAAHTSAELGVLWPAIASRVGIALDRRGIHRLVGFTASGRVGSRVQLAGQWVVVRSRDAFQLRASAAEGIASSKPVAADHGLEWEQWSFRPATTPLGADQWSAVLPEDRPIMVRRWQRGDVMTVRLGGRATKVKRLLSKAGVTGHDRPAWPVVLSGDQIVWIPGVSRSDAVTARSGRPGLPFICEYNRR